MLLAAYRVFLDSGVDLVPGSDLHGIHSGVGRGGEYVPWMTFETLHLSPQDSAFVWALLKLDHSGPNGDPRAEDDA